MKSRVQLKWSACLVALALAGLGGCSAIAVSRSSHAISDCEGALLSTRYIHGNRRLHDRVRYSSGETSLGYDIITEVDDDGLRVIVLTTFGNKAMGLRQIGDGVEIANYMNSQLAVAPMNVLRDLHRVHFLRSGITAGDTTQHDSSIGGFDVTERLQESVIIRRIAGPDLQDRSTVTIDSDAAVIERDGCGYRARFVTLP